MSETVVTCSNCSAPLEYRDGDAVAYCVYCGEVHTFREEKDYKEHYMLDLFVKPENLRSFIIGDLLKIPGVPDSIHQSLQITKSELKYIPYYVTQVHGNLMWTGLGRQATFHLPYRGAYRKISFHTEPESGVFDDQVTVIVYAGKEQNELLSNHKIAVKGRKFFSKGEITKHAGLLIDEAFDFNQAEIRAVEQLQAKHDRLLNEELQVVESLTPDYKIAQNQLIHAPMWFVKWKSDNGSDQYTTIIDAASGSTIETDTPRSLIYLLFAFGLGAVYILIGLFPYLLMDRSTMGRAYATSLPLILGIILGFQTFWKNRPKTFKERRD